jgi:hypothetical protein
MMGWLPNRSSIPFVGVMLASLGSLACEEACEGFDVDSTFDCSNGCGPPGALLWARTHQGGVSGNPSALAVDACGAVVGTGTLTPDATLGSDTTWTAKYGPNGRRAWTRTRNDRSGERSYAVAVDHDGGVVIGGEATDHRSTRAVVRAYDTHGVERWARNVAGGGAVHELAADSAGGIVGVLDHGGLFRLDRDGDMQWIVLDHGLGALSELATSDDGRFAVTVRSPSQDPPGHVVVFTLDGEEQWRYATEVAPRDLAFGATGDVFVLEDGGDQRVVRVDPAGRTLATLEVDPRFHLHVFVNALEIDSEGHVILAGGVEPDDERVNAAWAAKLSIDGDVRWEWTIDRPGDSSCDAVATDRHGAVFVTTRVDASIFSGTLDSDIWVGRLAP